jgi:hypothetical protein
MMNSIEREDWAERLGQSLRDHYGAVPDEPIPERLRELVEQLERRRSTGTLLTTPAAPPDEHPS